MQASLLCLCGLVSLAPVSAFTPAASPLHRPRGVHALRPSPLAMRETETESPGMLQDAWAKYVLIRPGMDLDGLKDSTKLRTAKSWSWNERTPGTARTVVFTVALVGLVAIPALLMNPTVFAYLVNFATLSAEGLSPWDVYIAPFLERAAY